jgi:phage gpG-like protein
MPGWPVDIQVEIRDEGLKALMRDLMKNGKDLTRALKRSGVHMMTSMDKNFKMQGRPQSWKPLSPNTIAGRRKGSGVILQDKGMLRMSVLSRTSKGNIYRLGKDSLVMGSSLKIASYHQYGTSPYTIRPKTKKMLRFMTVKGMVFTKQVNHPGLPARPFALIHREDERAIADIFADHIVRSEQAKAAWMR